MAHIYDSVTYKCVIKNDDKKMPITVLNDLDFLDFINQKINSSNSNGKAIFKNIDELINELNSMKNLEVSKRTVYRKIADLRSEEKKYLIESHNHYQLFKVIDPKKLQNILVLNDNDQIIDTTIEKRTFTEKIGEQRLLIFEITDKGKKFLENEKKQFYKK